VRIVRGASEVRRLLTRAPQDEGPPPQHLAEGIRRIFGEPLTVGGGVSMENTSALGRVSSNR